MQTRTLVLVAVLAVVAFGVIVAGAVHIVTAQLRAQAPPTIAPAPVPGGTQVASVVLTPAPLLPGEIARSLMPAVISLTLLAPCTLIVVSRDRPADHQKWATAAISSIVTYWLR